MRPSKGTLAGIALGTVALVTIYRRRNSASRQGSDRVDTVETET